MGQSQATNQIERNVEYYIPEGTTTEVVFGGTPGTLVWNATLSLYPRSGKKTTQIFPPNVSNENQWLIDGNFYEKFIITGDSDFNALWDAGKLTGFYHVGYRLSWGMSATGGTRYEVTNKYSESLFRLLEKLSPRLSAANPVSFNGSIAAAGSQTGTLSVNPGDELVIIGGISQDTLGTSPHASYIYINDQNAYTLWQIIGAVIPYSTVKVRVPYQDKNVAVTFAWKAFNGDSVAHWFTLNVYRIIA